MGLKNATIRTTPPDKKQTFELELLQSDDLMVLREYLKPAIDDIVEVFCGNCSDNVRRVHKENLQGVVLSTATKLFLGNSQHEKDVDFIFSEYYSYFAKKYTDYHFPEHKHSVALADGEYIEWVEQDGYIKTD